VTATVRRPQPGAGDLRLWRKDGGEPRKKPARPIPPRSATKPDNGAWGRSGDPYDERWLHNDMQNMAFFYTHKLFEKLVDLGEMK